MELHPGPMGPSAAGFGSSAASCAVLLGWEPVSRTNCAEKLCWIRPGGWLSVCLGEPEAVLTLARENALEMFYCHRQQGIVASHAVVQ